ncbi:MAG: hypothetical protein MI861_15135 [Pirellulales bacterium]|nr:hypothetical protein [Pirellulales bacterium]
MATDNVSDRALNRPTFSIDGSEAEQSPMGQPEQPQQPAQEKTAELPQRYQIWLGRIIAAGEHGVTLDELSQQTGIPANEFSGRITELKQRGLVQRTSQRRPTRKGSTAAVIVAAPRALKQSVKHQRQPASKNSPADNDLPGGMTNAETPRDQYGRLITHGQRYRVPGVGLVEVYYETDEDEFYIFRPLAPEKRQPLRLLPPQTGPWRLTCC